MHATKREHPTFKNDIFETKSYLYETLVHLTPNAAFKLTRLSDIKCCILKFSSHSLITGAKLEVKGNNVKSPMKCAI